MRAFHLCYVRFSQVDPDVSNDPFLLGDCGNEVTEPFGTVLYLTILGHDVRSSANGKEGD